MNKISNLYSYHNKAICRRFLPLVLLRWDFFFKINAFQHGKKTLPKVLIPRI